MTRLPKAYDFPPLIKSTDRHAKTTKIAWYRMVATIMNPDLLAVIAFCLIGVLLALNIILRFPEFGAVIEQYNQF
jgi:hypothetical protein